MTKSRPTFRVGCIQLNVGPDAQENWGQTEKLIRDCVQQAGVHMVVTPECCDFIQPDRNSLIAQAQYQKDSFTLNQARILAADLNIWLVLGSLMLKQDQGSMLINRQILLNPKGRIETLYDKIHMFDVEVGDGQVYRESDTFHPGSRAAVTALPWGKLGHSICYDLRFAYLYRQLAHEGADFLVTPAAFTQITGQAHWHVLQRARAIETGCFVFAANQCGVHAAGRQTFGHSLIVDPWGTILAEAEKEPGWIWTDIDPALVAQARTKIPALHHDRVLGSI